jgi:hypothetical protein
MGNKNLDNRNSLEIRIPHRKTKIKNSQFNNKKLKSKNTILAKENTTNKNKKNMNRI